MDKMVSLGMLGFGGYALLFVLATSQGITVSYLLTDYVNRLLFLF